MNGGEFKSSETQPLGSHWLPEERRFSFAWTLGTRSEFALPYRLQALGCEASHLTIRGLSFLICKGKENTGLAQLSLSGSGAEMCSADVGYREAPGAV